MKNPWIKKIEAKNKPKYFPIYFKDVLGYWIPIVGILAMPYTNIPRTQCQRIILNLWYVRGRLERKKFRWGHNF